MTRNREAPALCESEVDMQKQICVTVMQTETEKSELSLQVGESLLSMLIREKIVTFANCGGRGTCGRCRIRFLEGETPPGPADRKMFTPDQLRKGYRLACTARPGKDCVIHPDFLGEKKLEIMTAYRKKSAESSHTVAGERDVIAAIDLGTTTIAMQLLGATSGIVITSHSMMNPERIYGSDVISRMQASIQGKRQEICMLIRNAIEEGVSELLRKAESLISDEGVRREIHLQMVVLSGNTTMNHLFMGYDVEGLGQYPFQPVTLGQIETECDISVKNGNIQRIQKIRTILMPGISAFVGGDIFSGLLSQELLQQGDVKEEQETVLFIDLGTNGEIVLQGGKKAVGTATLAGPAFEGGANAEVPGTEMISILSQLLETRTMDETGLLRSPYFEEGVWINKVYINQKHIRDLQMAKAAVRAGIEVLLETLDMTVEEVDKVYLAGGFGYWLNAEAAERIGLLPSGLSKRTVAVGNTSLDGAGLYGRLLWQKDQDKLKQAEFGARQLEVINLAAIPGFEEKYIRNMNFEQA